MMLKRTKSATNGLMTLSPHASSLDSESWDVGLHVASRSTLAPNDGSDSSVWPQEACSGLKVATLSKRNHTYQELLIIALLKLFNASHKLMAPGVEERTGSPLQKLFRKICSDTQLGDMPTDSRTLEEMLRRAEAEEEAEAEIASMRSESAAPSEADDLSQGSEQSLLWDDEGEVDLDALDDLDGFYAVSDTFGSPDAPWRGQPETPQLFASSFAAFGLIEDSWAAKDDHLSSSFVKKSGTLARNDACVDLAQLDALACPE
mmetsp:Transcript_14807/g.34731  ORF Transcript_14807/g.34731 Transcript_14807/m.34731 type:complete len:261 (-) Transcript_14807:99-881(-)